MRSRASRLAIYVAVPVGAGLALWIIFWGLTTGLGPGDREEDAVYRPVPVERGDLRQTVVASGRMEPIVRVPVIAEVSGIIAAVHVDEGERVRSGQLLFELDRERLAARVAERRADLALARANARFDLVGRAHAERDHALRERNRIAALKQQNVASVLELDDAELALRLAEIAVRDAEAETAARKAGVDRARELLRQAERDLENARVRAPIDGVVIEREGEVGRAVADVTANGGTVIAVIADDRRIRLLAEIDENDIALVRVGQSALVSIDAFADEEFAGRVHKISAAGTAEGSVSNFELEIRLDPDPRLRIGMSSDARVLVQEHRDVLLIPNLAIVHNGRGGKVRRAEVGAGAGGFGAADAAELVPIETGYSDGFHTIVERGLDEGDVVMVRSEAAHE